MAAQQQESDGEVQAERPTGFAFVSFCKVCEGGGVVVVVGVGGVGRVKALKRGKRWGGGGGGLRFSPKGETF